MAGNEGIFSKAKWENVNTPTGSSLWTKVVEPDFKFDKDGRYEASILMDPNDENVQAFKRYMEGKVNEAIEVAKQNLPKNKAENINVNYPVETYYDKEDNDTGLLIFKSKSKASYNGDPITIGIYNVRGQKMDDFSDLIGNGSQIKLQVSFRPYHIQSSNTVGLSIKLKRVQIISITEYDGGAFGDESGNEYNDDTSSPVVSGSDF
jgi:hypothetical protein